MSGLTLEQLRLKQICSLYIFNTETITLLYFALGYCFVLFFYLCTFVRSVRMCVCACVHVYMSYMYVCIYVYMYVCMFVCMHVYVCVCVYVCRHVSGCAGVWCLHAFVRVCMRACMCARMCIRMYYLCILFFSLCNKHFVMNH